MPTDLRSDVAAFSRRVLRRRLWPHQVEAATSEAFITAIAAARRTGKTVTAETLAMHTAFANRGCRVLVLSATQDAARRLTESIGQTLSRNRLTRGAVVDDFKSRISLTTGSQIISLPASQRQVRGYGEGVLLVILDEAGFMPSELWQAAHYTALDERASGARILMIGTPWGGPDHFFRRAFESGQDGDPDHASFHWTYEANPNLDHAYLERMRDRVSPTEYAAEIEGEWSDALGSLFSRELLDRNTADVQLPGLGGLRGPARLLLGLDFGVSYDRSAAVALARLPVAALNPHRPPSPVFGVAAVEIWPAGEPLSRVVAEVVASPADWAVISPEVSGVGAGPSQQLREAIGRKRRAERELARRQSGTEPSWSPPIRFNEVATSAQKKTDGYGWIRYLLEEGRLVLPRHPDLLRQLAGLRFEIGERGFVRIEADDPATHDDVADALMLAAGPHRQPSGRVSCVLAQAARSPQPDAAIPGGLETVQTGGGLVVPRRPVLQSIGGLQVTEPPRAQPTDPVIERAQAVLRRRPKEVQANG
jgi:Terminase large subunit, T4likevirus-type, N-terminal